MSDLTRMSGDDPIVSRCRACTNRIHYVECPTGGWWAHDKHPADGHDALSPLRVIEEMDDNGDDVVTGTAI